MCSSSSNVLDPMAQDSSEQDIVMGEQELPPQMDPKPEMAQRRQMPRSMTPPLPSSETLPRSLPKRLSKVDLT